MSDLKTQAGDIQGIIFSGYGDLYYSCYLFLKITDAGKARAWLAAMANEVTTGKWDDDATGSTKKPGVAVNLAFTPSGLAAMGLAAAALNTFAQEFQEGMAEPSRSRRLGDNGLSAPVNWEIGGLTKDGASRDQIHLLLILQAPSRQELSQHRKKQETRLSQSGLAVTWTEEGHRQPDQHEHFGFRDSISQPEIEGSPKPPADAQTTVKAGEFILGHLNSYGHLPPTPIVSRAYDVGGHLRPAPPGGGNSGDDFRDLGLNGSYLVFRKLHQDVAGFRLFFQERFTNPDEQALMIAKTVGRWPSGAPLALTPEHDDPGLTLLPKSNDFGYANTDPHGYGCPIGSHIRRSNPRDSLGSSPEESLTRVNRHRILRRGASYGEPLPEGATKDDDQPRGLLFLCLNADINRQFEFLQQTWINNPKFNGLYNDRDPLVGDNLEPHDQDESPRLMTVQRQPVRLRIKEIPRFVTVKGGDYFFLPSIAVLRFLSALAPANT